MLSYQKVSFFAQLKFLLSFISAAYAILIECLNSNLFYRERAMPHWSQMVEAEYDMKHHRYGRDHIMAAVGGRLAQERHSISYHKSLPQYANHVLLASQRTAIAALESSLGPGYRAWLFPQSYRQDVNDLVEDIKIAQTEDEVKGLIEAKINDEHDHTSPFYRFLIQAREAVDKSVQEEKQAITNANREAQVDAQTIAQSPQEQAQFAAETAYIRRTYGFHGQDNVYIVTMEQSDRDLKPFFVQTLKQIQEEQRAWRETHPTANKYRIVIPLLENQRMRIGLRNHHWTTLCIDYDGITNKYTVTYFDSKNRAK